MRFHRILIASALLSLSAAASSQTVLSADGQQTLRGFRIGDQCPNLDANFDALRKEGFKIAPARHTCFFKPGEYFVEDILQTEDGKSELVELSFAPNSVLWRIKVSLTWERIHRLSSKPTPEQAIASLEKRFGTPYSKSVDGDLADGTRGGARAVAFTWSDRSDATSEAFRDSSKLGWRPNDSKLMGTVTQAVLNWSDESSRQTLVVELTNRQMLPLAVAAQRDSGRQDAARKAEVDSSMLNKL